jgi:antagonist of KipI
VIEIVTAPPYLTVQDRGRFGHRASGVPVSGAMDVEAMDAANGAVGNNPGTATLEWALGGGAIRFTVSTRIALRGATAESVLDEERIDNGGAHDVAAGAVLRIGRFMTGRFLYIAIRGGVDVPIVLGSRSTYVPARLGGHEGRLIRTGDRLAVGTSAGEPSQAAHAYHRAAATPLRAIRGPDANQFTLHAWTTFVSKPFRVSTVSDRTGYRLEGPAIDRVGSAETGPSAPVCPGVVQVPSSGQPVVLMADAPTIGGYPMLAVVSSADLPRLAQCRPGDTVRFTDVSV